jgi:exodeoxyribonuclease VII large subunit
MAESIQQIFSVSDFIAVFNQTLEYAYPSVSIEGEIASFKVNQGKFVFFDLKDQLGSIGCFMMVWQLRLPIIDGMKVVVSAVPKLTQWGKFSLTIKSIRPSGEGAIKKSFEILKAKLQAEGLFAPERKRQLPAMPQHVAVISSLQAAGYADFIKILSDRWGGVQVDVAHVQVQGEGSADQIIRAINYFNQQEDMAEVLVIIRGGGSADDLSTFNDELLVRSIAGSRIPTLVGIGHEIDESLADLAADVRAATPSNAAQILVPEKTDIIRSVHRQVEALVPQMLQLVDRQRQVIQTKLESALETTNRAVDGQIRQLVSSRNVLAQLNPNTILDRGYALVRGRTQVGSVIEVETNKVIMKAEVKDVNEK